MTNQAEIQTETSVTFADLHRSKATADVYITAKENELKADGTYDWILEQLALESSFHPEDAAPGQGLRVTGYEGNSGDLSYERQALSEDLIRKTIHGWLYYLYLFNHPERIASFKQQSTKEFVPPAAKFNPFFFIRRLLRKSITINDIKLSASGSDRPRVQRGDAHRDGLWVSYHRAMNFFDRLQNTLGLTEYDAGRYQARSVLVGAANQDITGTPMALATLAQAHSLACVPRNGIYVDVEKQVALVKKAQEWLERSPILNEYETEDREMLLDAWKHNLIGVLEANPDKAVRRARALYAAGIRTFRIYSPEPSSAPLETLKKLRKMEKELGWEPIEIFVGQVVSVEQALQLEKAGANALYFGIGGGGRCITGVVAGLTINWPELVWRLRGKLKIPMIVEGGANDHLPESLAIGVSGVGVAGKLAATIETPGGWLFLIDEHGRMFKFYGGEASNRTRAAEGREPPEDFMQSSEGKTTSKYLTDDVHTIPTMLQIIYDLNQGIVGGLVFQNARNITEMHERGADSVREASANDDAVRHAHNI